MPARETVVWPGGQATKIHIPKKTGGFRIIYAPDEATKKKLRLIQPGIRDLAARATPYAHAFVSGRSPVTAALVHAHQPWVVCADLKDFFDNVTADAIMAGAHLAAPSPELITIEQLAEMLPLILINGAPRQGLPTSPAAANLGAAVMDHALVSALPPGCTYTRYADDLTVGAKTREAVLEARETIARVVQDHGHQCHPKKWQLQDARAGARVIVGVVVDFDAPPRATRRARRKLRAALHRSKTAPSRLARMEAARHARGLAEWCAMRLPVEQTLHARFGRRGAPPGLVQAMDFSRRSQRWLLRRAVNGLVPRYYLRAERYLLDAGVPHTTAPSWALSLAQVFGADWQSWVTGAQKMNVSLETACAPLPTRDTPESELGSALLTWRRELPSFWRAWAEGEFTALVDMWPRLDATARAARRLAALQEEAKALTKYAEAEKHRGFAIECVRQGVDEDDFARYLARWLRILAKPITSTLPPPGEIARVIDYYAEIMRRDDPQALWIGTHTACCMHPEGQASTSAWHAISSPDGGVLAIRDNATGTIAAGSWLWRYGDVIVADNSEARGGHRNMFDLYEAAAKAILNYDSTVNEVRMGTRYSQVINPKWPKVQPVPTPKGCYTDARTQVLIAKRKKNT